MWPPELVRDFRRAVLGIDAPLRPADVEVDGKKIVLNLLRYPFFIVAVERFLDLL